MSVRQITKVFDMRVGDYIAKAVLVKLADFANDEGTSWPSIGRIAQDTEIPERTVKRKLAWLEAEGFIERRRSRGEGGQFGLTFYIIRPQPEATVAPGTAGHGEPPGANAPASTRVPFPVSEPSEGTPPKAPPRPLKVDNQPVTDSELELATAVLAVWNDRAKSNPPFRAESWIRKIVMRIREHPDLDLDGHTSVIEGALADPWWTGASSPAVVYGNDSLFEQVAHGGGGGRRNGRRFGRGLTAAEIIERGKG